MKSVIVIMALASLKEKRSGMARAARGENSIKAAVAASKRRNRKHEKQQKRK